MLCLRIPKPRVLLHGFMLEPRCCFDFGRKALLKGLTLQIVLRSLTAESLMMDLQIFKVKAQQNSNQGPCKEPGLTALLPKLCFCTSYHLEH